MDALRNVRKRASSKPQTWNANGPEPVHQGAQSWGRGPVLGMLQFAALLLGLVRLPVGDAKGLAQALHGRPSGVASLLQAALQLGPELRNRHLATEPGGIRDVQPPSGVNYVTG